MFEFLPEFLCNIRCHWSEEHQQSPQLLLREGRTGFQEIEVSHQRGHDGIILQGCQILGHAFDQTMDDAPLLSLWGLSGCVLRVLCDQCPDAVEEAHDPADPAITEVTSSLI